MSKVNEKRLIANVIQFLHFDAASSSSDKKESIEIAIQCLESAYGISSLERVEPKEYDGFLSLFKCSVLELGEEDQCLAETYKITGNDLMKMEKYQEALEQYNLAIQSYPNNAVYYSNRSAAHMRLKNHREAVRDCQRAITLNSNYDKAYARLGISYSSLKMHTEAIEAFQKAVSLDPTNRTYQDNLKLAIQQSQDDSSTSSNFATSFNEFISSPHLMNLASEMLNTSQVYDLVTGMFHLRDDNGANLSNNTSIFDLEGSIARLRQHADLIRTDDPPVELHGDQQLTNDNKQHEKNSEKDEK